MEEIDKTIKKLHTTNSQLNDYLNVIVETLIEKGLMSKEEVNIKFNRVYQNTYVIGGEVILTKYNITE